VARAGRQLAVVYGAPVRPRGALPPGVIGSGRRAGPRAARPPRREARRDRARSGARRDRSRGVVPVRSGARADRLGAIGELGRGDSHFELRPGAGVSFALTDELRLGAEIYAELSSDSERESWAAAGPDLAWTHGRFWLAAAFGIGFYQIETAPRVVWGILF